MLQLKKCPLLNTNSFIITVSTQPLDLFFFFFSFLTALAYEHGCYSLIKSLLSFCVFLVPCFILLQDKPFFVQHDAEQFLLKPVLVWLSL